MLIDKSEYNMLISNIQNSGGDIMKYFLDPGDEKDNIFNKVFERVEGLPFTVGSQYSNLNAHLKDRIQPPVEKWIAGFRDAKLIITDSFHACVFSIIYNKPFVVIGNKERGMSRFVSLLKEFHIEDRLVCEVNEIDKIQNLLTLPGYVSQILAEKRDYSLKYLTI